jgi:hypothetical protein
MNRSGRGANSSSPLDDDELDDVIGMRDDVTIDFSLGEDVDEGNVIEITTE